MTHKHTDYVRYSRADIEAQLMFNARLKLVGRMYVGEIGEPSLRWLDDGDVEVFTPHTPGVLPAAEAGPPRPKRKYRRRQQVMA